MTQTTPDIGEEPPTRDDVAALLKTHLKFSRAASPLCHAHALDSHALSAGGVTFCVARRNGELLGIGALRDLGGDRAEIKSMHTSAAARGQGIGRMMLEYLIAMASDRGVTWIGLETGTMDEFAPARRLYESVGFTTCPPFGSYTENPLSTCMAKTRKGSERCS